MLDKSVFLFGEVLFDCFPGQTPVLGGAPLNVAWHLKGFGVEPNLVTAIGNDPLGNQLRDKMSKWGLSLEFVQTTPHHPTGIVDVSFEDGEPQYEITSPVAWDYIDKQLVPVPDDALIYHGSLATRNHVSQEALTQLLGQNKDGKIIDVNLRPPFWEREQVLSSLHYGLLVKLSLEELYILSDEPDLPWDEQALQLKRSLDIVNILITRGGDGATLFDATGERHDTTSDTQIVRTINSTVGAGDAFTSVIILGMLNNWSWHYTIECAHQFAGYIVTQQGAIVEDITIYQDFINLWNI
ncbi:carbohydrate kinase family protein [Vibrio sp. RC27]